MSLTYLISTFLVPIFMFAQGIQFEHISYNEALNKAKVEHKYIFVDAFTEWCGPCKMLSARVFPNSELGSYFNSNFINLKLDMEKGEGLDFSRKYGIKAYPTLLLLDETGKEVNRKMGYTEAPALLEWAKKSSDPSNTLEQLESLLNKGTLTPSKIAEYAISEYQKENFSKAEAIAVKYYESQKNWETDEAKGLFSLLKTPILDPYSYYVKKINTDGVLKIGNQEVSASDFVSKKFVFDFQEFTKNNPKLVTDPKKSAKTIYGDMGKQLYRLYAILETQTNKDFNGFVTATNSYLNKYAKKDPVLLNQYAWEVYESEVATEKQNKTALKWALKSVKSDSKYYNNDTVAALYYKLKNKEKARKYAEEAIALGLKEEEDTSETKNLLKKINNLP